MTDERILDRIQKLLAMSKDVGSPNEAAIAARRAAALMHKHNLEEADVILKDLGSDDIQDVGADAGNTALPDWMHRIAVPIARLMECDARIYMRGKRKIITYLGQKDDAQVAAWIFMYLVDEIKRLSKVHRRNLRKRFGAGHGRNMGDYRDGVVQEILLTLYRMKEEREAALKDHKTGTALVVLKQELIEKKFGETGYSKSETRSIDDPDNYHAGRRDGKGVRINPAIEGGTKRDRLSK